MFDHQVKRFSRRKIYKGYCYDVVLDEVLWPNQKHVKRDLILHPGISIFIPLLDRDHIILIRQYRYGAGRALWELPAGTIGPNETPLACAKREILEETGYRARSWKKILTSYASPGYTTEVIHGYLASNLVQLKPCLEDDEILQEKIFSIREVAGMIQRREIVDNRSLSLLFYFLTERNGKK